MFIIFEIAQAYYTVRKYFKNSLSNNDPLGWLLNDDVKSVIDAGYKFAAEPQSISTVSELMNIASVKYQIISPRENKPIITIVQDTLLGINKLTKGETIHYKSINSLKSITYYKPGWRNW